MGILEKRSNRPLGQEQKILQGHFPKIAKNSAISVKKSSSLSILTQFDEGKALDASFHACESAQKTFPLTW